MSTVVMDMCKTDNAQFYYQKENKRRGGGGGSELCKPHKRFDPRDSGLPRSTATRPQLISRAAGRGTESTTLAA